MFKSKEIRWFTKEVNPNILKWFETHHLSFDTTTPRTDFYLPLPEKPDMGVKLREGQVEIKIRKDKPVADALHNNATGNFELWEKWSFKARLNDSLALAIIEEKEYDWVEVYKERIGVKLTLDEERLIVVRSIKERLSYGCQVEYTRIIVNHEEWFTFCFEWFGDDEIELDTQLIGDILGDSKLAQKDSMGYPQFLNLNSDG